MIHLVILSTPCPFSCILFEKYENTFFEDYIVNLNSILLNSSFKLEIQENIEKKIHLSHIIDENKTTVYAKNFFKVKKNSKLILIENFDINLKSNSNIVNYFEKVQLKLIQ